MGWCEDWISSPLLSILCALDHCCKIWIQGQTTGGDTQNVLWLDLHEMGIYFMILYWSNNAGNKRGAYVCICERAWAMNHNVARTPHSSSLKTITCYPCRWQLQWCTSVLMCVDKVGQTLWGLTSLELMIHICSGCKCLLLLSSRNLHRGLMWVTQCMLYHNDDSLHYHFKWVCRWLRENLNNPLI